MFQEWQNILDQKLAHMYGLFIIQWYPISYSLTVTNTHYPLCLNRDFYNFDLFSPFQLQILIMSEVIGIVQNYQIYYYLQSHISPFGYFFHFFMSVISLIFLFLEISETEQNLFHKYDCILIENLSILSLKLNIETFQFGFLVIH